MWRVIRAVRMGQKFQGGNEICVFGKKRGPCVRNDVREAVSRREPRSKKYSGGTEQQQQP